MPVAELRQREKTVEGKRLPPGANSDGLQPADLKPVPQGAVRAQGALHKVSDANLEQKPRSWPMAAWLQLAGFGLLVVFSVTTRHTFAICGLFSAVCGVVTYRAVPEVSELLLAAGRSGRDLNKLGQPVRAESLGVAVGTVYLICMFLFLPFPFLDGLKVSPLLLMHEPLGLYTAALLSIASMLFLGFADDVLNLKWRHKVLLPAMAALPLLMLYRVTGGATSVVLPWPVDRLLGQGWLEIGMWYYVFMAAVAVFCTHSINILAGVNGVEVGQACVIAGAVLVHNALFLLTASADEYSHSLRPYHQFSMMLVAPFLCGSLALLAHNWYPASVFVGDTFCYFAGMTLAVSGILGHFSKTLLLFFAPQVLNFVLSVPQLVGIVPCPRHRLPRLDAKDGKLRASTFAVSNWTRCGRLKGIIIGLLEGLGLVSVRFNAQTDELECTNLTLLSVLLVRFGPMGEESLARLFLLLQASFCVLGLLIRHVLAPAVYSQ